MDVDGADGLLQAVEHLIANGHRRIAAIAWPDDSRIGNERMRGYFQAMQSAGLEARPEWIERGKGTYEFGREAAFRLFELLEENRPTAIVTLNDTQATFAHYVQRANVAWRWAVMWQLSVLTMPPCHNTFNRR